MTARPDHDAGPSVTCLRTTQSGSGTRNRGTRVESYHANTYKAKRTARASEDQEQTDFEISAPSQDLPVQLPRSVAGNVHASEATNPGRCSPHVPGTHDAIFKPNQLFSIGSRRKDGSSRKAFPSTR